MSSFYGSSYYWFAILVMAIIAITVWCWKCHKDGQERRDQILARNLDLLQPVQGQEQPEERPSDYRPDSPPAYDDVINKPDDYPVYNEGSSSATIPSSPVHNDTQDEAQQLPSYQDVIRLSGNFTAATSVLSPEQIRIDDQLELRTTGSNTRTT